MSNGPRNTDTTPANTDASTLLDKSGETSGELIFSAFGSATITSTRRVDIPADRIAAFKRAASHFNAPGVPNSAVLPVNCPLPDGTDAETFRREVQQYADDHNLTAGFPKFSPDKWAVKLTMTGEDAAEALRATFVKRFAGEAIRFTVRNVGDNDDYVLSLTMATETEARSVHGRLATTKRDGVTLEEPTLVAGNKYPKTWNVGTNVTFRLVNKRIKPDNGSGSVTVSHVTK